MVAVPSISGTGRMTGSHQKNPAMAPLATSCESPTSAATRSMTKPLYVTLTSDPLRYTDKWIVEGQYKSFILVNGSERGEGEARGVRLQVGSAAFATWRGRRSALPGGRRGG